MKNLFGLLRCLTGCCPWRTTGKACLGGEQLQTENCSRCYGQRYRSEKQQ